MELVTVALFGLAPPYPPKPALGKESARHTRNAMWRAE